MSPGLPASLRSNTQMRAEAPAGDVKKRCRWIRREGHGLRPCLPLLHPASTARPPAVVSILELCIAIGREHTATAWPARGRRQYTSPSSRLDAGATGVYKLRRAWVVWDQIRGQKYAWLSPTAGALAGLTLSKPRDRRGSRPSECCPKRAPHALVRAVPQSKHDERVCAVASATKISVGLPINVDVRGHRERATPDHRCALFLG